MLKPTNAVYFFQLTFKPMNNISHHAFISKNKNKNKYYILNYLCFILFIYTKRKHLNHKKGYTNTECFLNRHR